MNAMSKFSDAERSRIINATRATLARGEADREPPSTPEHDDLQREELLAKALSEPLETRNQRDRRELEEQEARFARSRRAEQRGSSAPAPDLDLRIASAIADEREFQREILANVIVEMDERREKAIDALRIELAELKLSAAEVRVKNCELAITNAELRQELDRGKIVPLRSVN